jgi:hypothetical protein
MGLPYGKKVRGFIKTTKCGMMRGEEQVDKQQVDKA